MYILLIQKKNDLANQAQAPAAGNPRGAARRGTKRKGGDEWNDI